MSDPPPFPVRLGIVALKATALWVNTMLTFLQDEFPHPEEVEQELEEQAQEQEQEQELEQEQEQEQEQQELSDEEQQQDQNAAARISDNGGHFTEEYCRRRLLSLLLRSQGAVEPAAGSSPTAAESSREPVRDQMNGNDEETDRNHTHNHQSDWPNDIADRTSLTVENTVMNEVVKVAPHIQTEQATVAGAIEILLALSRQDKSKDQNEGIGNDEHQEQVSQSEQVEQNQQNNQIERSEQHEQHEAQQDFPPSSMITRRMTRGAVAMKNRMELESLQGAMNSAAAAEALEASRTRGQNSDDMNGVLDTEAQGSRPSVVIPRAFTFNHVSTPQWPNGDVVYRFAYHCAPHMRSWVWSEYSRTQAKGVTTSLKACMGADQCPKCGYAQRPLLSHRKKIPGAPNVTQRPKTACEQDGTPLVHVACSAKMKVVGKNDNVEIIHSSTHNHGKPLGVRTAKRTYDEMEGIVHEGQSTGHGRAGSAASQSIQPRRTGTRKSAATQSTRPQPSVMIDNTVQGHRRVAYGVHVDRTKAYGKWTYCSVCHERIGRKALRVVDRVRDCYTSDPHRVMYYHTTCLSALSKSDYKKVQGILENLG
ncbi:hypothetical protein EC968_001750 [Mortierella alpina]|nr:hypothetical protein EC968_001750 [Mortierella alpina]